MTTGPPLTPMLYDATTVHVRREPVHRRFRYGLYLWLVDIDDLPRLRSPLGVLARFRARDHIGDARRSIRANIDRELDRSGVGSGDGPVIMLAAPAFLGYVFNPLSLFWCYNADGALRAVVAEVHNTYGARHAYVLSPGPDGRVGTDKRLPVSPFLADDGRYEIRVPIPGRTLNVSVQLRQRGRTSFVATLIGERHAPRTRTLLGLALRYPLPTLRVSALIRWQGVRLWLRRLPITNDNRRRRQEEV